MLNTTVTLTGSAEVALARNPRRGTAVARREAPQQYDDNGEPVVLTPQPQLLPGRQAVPQQRPDDGYIYPADGSDTGARYPAPGGTSRRVYDAQAYPQQQPGYVQPQTAAAAPIAQDPPAAGPGTRRRGDAFDPNQNPTAPGAPQALGGGQLPVQPGRPAGDQAMPANTAGGRYPQGAAAATPGPGGLETAPPRQTPRDEYDLGIGYMQRRDYALAEQTMRNFTQKYPSDPMIGDAQYWLGESFFQRQQYRDAAEIFLAVTTKYEKSSKAADALLRLGQSLAALKEKEAACAAFGEVTRKYPRASAGVKSTVDREQKRVKC